MRANNKEINMSSVKTESSIHRLEGTHVKVRTNMHKFKEAKLVWRVKRNGYKSRRALNYDNAADYRYDYDWARVDQLEKLSSFNSDRLYNNKYNRHEQIRPSLWYTNYDERNAPKKRNVHNIYKYKNSYKYMLQGWHGIDKSIMNSIGFEGEIYRSFNCKLVYSYVDYENDRIDVSCNGYKGSSIYSLKGLPGIYFPGFLLMRTVNKNTPAYIKSIEKRKKIAALNRIEKEDFDFLGI